MGAGASVDPRRSRLADVWDEGEEMFGIGDEDDEGVTPKPQIRVEDGKPR